MFHVKAAERSFLHRQGLVAHFQLAATAQTALDFLGFVVA